MKDIRTGLEITNGTAIQLDEIPVLYYAEFDQTVSLLLSDESCHCVAYYAIPWNEGLKFICCIANDETHNFHVFSRELIKDAPKEFASLSQKFPQMHIYEREIWENFGVEFSGHPWLKPVRYPFDRFDQKAKVNDYPFYKIESNQLHEVGVGPIHAGVIEPGHFRFICNGEEVLHLEIQNGWQHRGVEKLMVSKNSNLKRHVLAESIAGDTAVGHNLAYTSVVESLADIKPSKSLQAQRAFALELERIAMHTADIGALCVDTAYQLGANVFGALRTPLINYFQKWCGNRFAKGLIRVGGTYYPLTKELRDNFKEMIQDFSKRFHEAAERTYNLPSQQNRFDGIGAIPESQARSIGAVGMVARMASVKRDIRWSHPFGIYEHNPYEPIVNPKGDVFSRFLLRRLEIEESIPYMLQLFDQMSEEKVLPVETQQMAFKANAFSISLVEGWRGEIVHTAVTDENGNIVHYKVKDPSFHNWKALEISLRNLEISDFPINNKSYDLSYCGTDL